MSTKTPTLAEFARGEIAKLRADVARPQVDDINTRLEHLSRRMDEAEHLLKRIHDHLSPFHRI